MDLNEIILVLYHDGISPVDRGNLALDAARIAEKLARKNLAKKDKESDKKNTYDSTIFDDLKEFLAAWRDKFRLYGVTKLHIIAHGNQKICGPYAAEALAEVIGGGGAMAIHDSLTSITIHSCMAGSPLNGSLHGATINASTKKSIFVEQVASALAKYIPTGRTIFIRGSDGKSYTDTDGVNWILSDTDTDVPRHPTKPQLEREAFSVLAAIKNKVHRAKTNRYSATSLGTAS